MESECTARDQLELAGQSIKDMIDVADRQPELFQNFIQDCLRHSDERVWFTGFLLEMLYTFISKSKTYGNSWREDGLDVRVLFGDLTKHYRRLRPGLWDDYPASTDATKLFESTRDVAVYCALIMRRLGLEGHEFDYEELKKLRGV